MCILNVRIVLLAIDCITKHRLLLLGQLRNSSHLDQREDSSTSGNRRASRNSSWDSFTWDASSFAQSVFYQLILLKFIPIPDSFGGEGQVFGVSKI